MSAVVSRACPVAEASIDAAVLADALDGLEAGVCLVDAHARLLHVNKTGWAIIEAGDVLQEIRGRLTACDLAANHLLQHALSAIVRQDTRGCIGASAIPLTGLDGARYVVHVRPLAEPGRNPRQASRAAAALFIRRAELTLPPRSEVLARAFKLTPSELRVMLSIVELGGVPDVAAALGVAETTVRTHVRRLFEKTGTARQADFVKLVAAYASPLRDDEVSR
jgi:DNA-binding CsgD family transcriptional regulator